MWSWSTPRRTANGSLLECEERTNVWAWKHPPQGGRHRHLYPPGRRRGLSTVDFGYEEGKIVLHNIQLYATPGQKIAFVGSTGAGKTTITNLINRFYDIADGKSATTASTSTRSKRATCAARWASFFRIPTCSPAP